MFYEVCQTQKIFKNQKNIINAYHKPFLKSSSFPFFTEDINSFSTVHIYLGLQNNFFIAKPTHMDIRKRI